MTDPARSSNTEPDTTVVRVFAVRRVDDDLDSFADTIIRLLDDGHTLVDLSHHDRRADTIELRVANRAERRRS